jgi:cephalosporin-C deacetylase-like acetyl esterase
MKLQISKEEQKMKKLFILLAALFCAAVYAATIDIVAAEDRDYKIGEEITFKVTAYESKDKLMSAGTFTLKITDSGLRAISVKADLSKGNPFTFKTKLDRAGFVFVKPTDYTLPDGKKGKWANTRDLPAAGGAAVEPEKIRQAGSVPEDFHKFWADGLKEFEKAEVSVVRAPELDYTDYKVSRITVTFPDKSGFIDGFLSIPVKKGKYPIIAGVPGAGPGVVKPVPYICNFKPSIRLFMNIFPFRTAATAKEQTARYNEWTKTLPAGKPYYHVYSENRDKFIYRNAFLALSRAVDHVALLPEFDGKNIAASGNSQGGGTALALAYLNKKITCAAASVPALCDHNGQLLQRVPGWPRLNLGMPNKKHTALPYFDGASFASFIKVPAIISVGYVDDTCYPASVYAAYNNLKGEKKIVTLPRAGHRNSAESRKILGEFIDSVFAR